MHFNCNKTAITTPVIVVCFIGPAVFTLHKHLGIFGSSAVRHGLHIISPFTISSHQITFTNMVSVDEKLTYKPHPEDPEK